MKGEGEEYLYQPDDITRTRHLRVVLDVGLVGCQGNGGIKDSFLLHQVGLYLVNAGGTSHPSNLSGGRETERQVKRERWRDV